MYTYILEHGVARRVGFVLGLGQRLEDLPLLRVLQARLPCLVPPPLALHVLAQASQRVVVVPPHLDFFDVAVTSRVVRR